MTTPPFALNIMDFIDPAQWPAIEDQSGLHTSNPFDCLAAFNAAIAALPSFGGIILVPPGGYFLSGTLNILDRCVRLEGAGCGEAGGEVSWMQWAQNVHGIRVFWTPATGKSGSGSLFRGLLLTGQGRNIGTIGHGIWSAQRIEVNDCQIGGFAQDGIHIEANAGGSGDLKGNANNWNMRRVRLSTNGGHGLFLTGSDVNAGEATAVSVSGNGWGANGGWGIWDSSFLGNTFLGCHAETNTLGAYKTDNQNARASFIGCYSEQDQPPSSIRKPSLVIGGLHEADFDAGTTIGDSAARLIAIAGVTADTSFGVAEKQSPDGPSIATQLGYNGTALNMNVAGDPGNIQLMRYYGQLGCFVDSYQNGDDSISFIRTTALNTMIDFDSGAPLPAGQTIFPQSWYARTSFSSAHKVTVSFDIAPPGEGDWIKGNLFYNTNPQPGGFVGWVCTVSGSPGTWKGFGVIAS